MPSCFVSFEAAIFGGIVTTALNNVIVTGNASAGLGHEYTDEEIECCYEEFYEDVHTEFLKFGEIVNFKVCKNGSFHLRGNVYVHYKSLDSAVLAYHSTNGRYFAGKQLKCEFIGVTRWKVAICGEYMKSGLKTCSHGTACNFIHCFRNPGGDYEWADWDKPPPKYWVKKMASLFGYSDETGYDKQMEQQSLERPRSCSKMITAEKHRCYSRRPRSREMDCLNANSSRSQYGENDIRKSTHRQRQTSDNRKQIGEPDGQMYEDKRYSTKIQHHNKRSHDSETDHNGCERDGNGYGNIERDSTRKKSRHQAKVLNFWNDHMDDRSRCYGSGSDGDCWDRDRVEYSGRHRHRTSKSSRHQKKAPEILDDHGYGEKQTHSADSGGDWSHDDRDADRYHGRRERSLRCSKGVSESPDHWCSKNSTHDGDLSGDWLEKSERRHSRTRGSRHFTDLSRFCDICEEPEKQLKWKFQCTESHPVKVEPQGVSRCSHRSRMDFSSTGANDGNSAGKGLRSDGAEEATSSYQYGLIIESHGSQSGYSIDKNMDKVINQESGNDISEKYMNSERNSRSENYEYDSPCRYTARSKSPESGYYSEENIDSRGRWEPDCPKLPRSSRRKGSGLDAEQCGGESDSRDNSYGYYSERRYRHHNHSSSGKHR